jgi:hypothetical protein
MSPLDQINEWNSDTLMEYLQSRGIKPQLYLSKKDEDVYLYSLEDLFIEICFKSNSSEIQKINYYTTIKKLDNYLEQLNHKEIKTLLFFP